MGKGVSTKTKQAKKTRLSEEEFKKQVSAAVVAQIFVGGGHFNFSPQQAAIQAQALGIQAKQP